MTPQDALNRLIENREIFFDEMVELMRQVMRGEVLPTQLAGILMGLRVRKESVEEIAAAASVMREFSVKVDVSDVPHLVDTCGTGGDGRHTLNVSTAAAFVAAAAGAHVAKHGGRSVSSKSGSADVLEALGVNINLPPERIALCIREVGVGFMFAPNHHPAMKFAAPVRKELGVRTIFNILGPLTNPAGAPNQVLGVFHADLVGIQTRVLKHLGSRHVLTVYGRDHLDEISLSDSTLVGELVGGTVREYEITPEQFGFKRVVSNALVVENAEQAKQAVLDVLGNVAGPARDMVAMNAGAAIFVSGIGDSLKEGVERARVAIESGAARGKLDQLIAFSRPAA